MSSESQIGETSINPAITALLERANRNDGPLEVNHEEFTQLLEAGGTINGIRDVEHTEGFKTQLWLMDPEGAKSFFYVFEDRLGVYA